MKAKRIIAMLLAVCLLCVFAVGCSDNAANSAAKNTDRKYLKTLPSAFTEDYIVCANKMDVEIIKNGTMMPYFSFYILSKEPLPEKAVKVNIDTDAAYEVLFQETEECKGKFPDYICYAYNNADFEKLKKVEEGSTDEALFDYYGKLIDEYDGLSDDEFPSFYCNRYFVQFDLNTINSREKINEMEVVINDFSKKLDLGTVSLIDKRTDRYDGGDFDLAFNSMGVGGLNIAGRTNGIFTIPAREAEINKDIIIKDIYLSTDSDSLSVNNVSIDLASDDGNINQKWKKGEDFEIKKGTDVSFNFEVKDTKFINNMNYSVNVYMVIEYESNGKMYTATNQAICETQYNGQILYAMYKDNVDFIPYYTVNPHTYY